VTYKIIRFYRDQDDPGYEVMQTGLTREEAVAHCNDPATRAEDGSWFEGFDKEEDQ
jgi:hypothetical protein